MVEKTLQACSAAPENRNIPSDSISLCKASAQDAPFLAKVYNQAILAGDCTCDTEPVTVEERETWIRQHAAEGYPVYLCLEDGKPVGYGYLTAYRPGRRAVAHVAEISYYLDFSAHRQPIDGCIGAARTSARCGSADRDSCGQQPPQHRFAKKIRLYRVGPPTANCSFQQSPHRPFDIREISVDRCQRLYLCSIFHKVVETGQNIKTQCSIASARQLSKNSSAKIYKQSYRSHSPLLFCGISCACDF